MKKKTICVFIGSRANYSSIKSALVAIQEHPGLELKIILGSSALVKKYGNMEKILNDDGFQVEERIQMLVEGDVPGVMVKTAALGMLGLSDAFDRMKPDYVVVIGDRYEVIAPTITAAYMNIPVVHTMGGEVTGTIDESIRHAITKFAHIHFPANRESGERIIKMGEEESRVFVVGCPRIDTVKGIIDRTPDVPEEIFKKCGGVGPEFNLHAPFLLISQHPVTTEYREAEQQINETIYAAMETGLPIILLWPNSDAGTEGISQGIRKFREKNPDAVLHAFTNLPIDMYVRLMNNTACLIGNSSSGIREGAFLGTPCVNIGTRQSGRERGSNVIDVDCERSRIYEAIRKQVAHGKYRSEPIYGDGLAGKKIADILYQTEVEVQKRITY